MSENINEDRINKDKINEDGINKGEIDKGEINLPTPIQVLVNTSTGEIENEFYPGDRLSIQRSSQLSYATQYVTNFNANESFVKIYDATVPLLEKYLTSYEFKFAICLIPHVSYKDCIIRRTQDRRSPILSMKDIATLHGYKYDYVRKIMASLKNKGVIGRHETGNILKCIDTGVDTGISHDFSMNSNVAFTVNPYIYFRGTDMVHPVYSFYSNSGWKELLMGEAGKQSNDNKITNQ